MTKFIVYKITNILNNKVYVGSAFNFKERKKRHIRDLKNNRHHSQRLQNSWNKHGETNFVFEILCQSNKKQLLEDEQRFINHYCSFEDKSGYNICPTAGNTAGRLMTQETKTKISNSVSGENNPFYGRKHTDRAKEQMSRKRAGTKAWNNKLTERQVFEIREKYIPRKYSQYKLAKEYGVSRSTIQSIIQFNNWSNHE